MATFKNTLLNNHSNLINIQLNNDRKIEEDNDKNRGNKIFFTAGK